jgi:hypothetical protein
MSNKKRQKSNIIKSINIHQWIAPAIAGRTSINLGRSTHYSGRSFSQLLQELQKAPIDIICKVFYSYSTLGELRKKKVFESLFPETYSGLLVIGGSGKSIERELFWACSVIRLFTIEINKYIRLKKEFERNLLLSNYDNCYLLLSQINDEVSHSVWALQNEILLGQLKDSLEGNKKALKKHPLHMNASIIGHFYSMCLEDKVTNDGFYIVLNERINKWRTGFPVFCTYFSFILDRLNFNTNEKIPSILQVANSNSIIDLYENAVNCIGILISDNKIEFNHHLEKLITEIALNNDDSRWKLIDNYIHPDKLVSTPFHKDKLMPILEAYTLNKFDEVIDKCRTCLIEYPNCADIYDIFVKSLFASAKPSNEIEAYLNITPYKSLLNSILNDYFNIVLKSNNTYGAITRILKMSRTLSTLSISESMYAFCIQHMPAKLKVNKQVLISRGLLNGCGGTPKFSIIFPNHQDKELFLKRVIQEYGELASLKPFKVLVSGDYVPTTYREKIYYNEKLLEKGDYSISITNLEALLDEGMFQLSYEKIIKCLLLGYSLTKELNKEISLLSKIIIHNKYLLLSLDVNEIFLRIKDIGIDSILLAMEKAIFVDYYLRCLPDIKKDNTERYNAYTDFLDRVGAETPSSLFEENYKMHGLIKEQMIYFYRYIANSETLEDDWHFENTDEQRKERIKICNYLCEIDNINSEVYQQEALVLISKIEINKFIRQADSSKIYVNTNKIINSLDDNFRENCERLLSLINLPKELREVKDFQGEDFQPLDKYDKASSKDSAFEQFKSIFHKLLDLFVLHDEYGIDQFLSGRIRHGVFDIDVRSVFEHHYLVTKMSEGKYLQNEYWFSETNKPNELLEKAFSQLSDNTDKILEIVNKEWIQVTTSIEFKHVQDSQSMFSIYLFDRSKVFSYIFTDSEIESHFKTIHDVQNVDEICEYVFSILWKHTEHCLEVMRWRMENILKDALINALEDFQKDIEIIDGITKERLVSNINSCRSELNHKISEVANWFKLSKTLTHDHYELENLINSCISIYNNWNSNYFVTYKVVCLEKRTFHAKTFQPLFDAIFITLGNIIKHALIKINTTDIIAFTNNDILTIIVKNELPEHTNIDELKIRLEKDYDRYDRTALRKEGRSGLHKMKNILKNSFSHELANFKYEVEDDNFFKVTISINIQELLK